MSRRKNNKKSKVIIWIMLFAILLVIGVLFSEEIYRRLVLLWKSLGIALSIMLILIIIALPFVLLRKKKKSTW